MAIITLTTDFGIDSPYVAQMKGVILTIAPSATIIDITHAIPPQDIFAGAIALADSARWFPPNTVHVAVVDPGVGTARRMIAVRAANHWFLAPDNGLLGPVLGDEPAMTAYSLENRGLWLAEVSSTFHGRDIFAPVAARLSLGIAADELGPRIGAMADINLPAPKISADEIVGEVIAVDSFGNLITNITESEYRNWLPHGKPQIACGTIVVGRIVRTYGEANPGECVALFGSTGRLEVSVAGGSAAQQLKLARGAGVRLRRLA